MILVRLVGLRLKSVFWTEMGVIILKFCTMYYRYLAFSFLINQYQRVKQVQTFFIIQFQMFEKWDSC